MKRPNKELLIIVSCLLSSIVMAQNDTMKKDNELPFDCSEKTGGVVICKLSNSNKQYESPQDIAEEDTSQSLNNESSPRLNIEKETDRKKQLPEEALQFQDSKEIADAPVKLKNETTELEYTATEKDTHQDEGNIEAKNHTTNTSETKDILPASSRKPAITILTPYIPKNKPFKYKERNHIIYLPEKTQ